MIELIFLIFGISIGELIIIIIFIKSIKKNIKKEKKEINDLLFKLRDEREHNKYYNIIKNITIEFLNSKDINLSKYTKTLNKLEEIKKEIKEKIKKEENDFKIEFEDDIDIIDTIIIDEEKYKPKNKEKNNNYKNKKYNKKELIAKGKNFEVYVGKYFEKLNYKIFYNGIINGRKDEGIDLIAENEKEIILIQCKNWKENSKYKIKDKHLKEFLGNCYLYIEKRPELLNKKITRLYVTSNDIFDKSAIKFLNENKDLITKMILKY